MHPQVFLAEMVSDRRGDLISEADAFRRAAEAQSLSVRSLVAVRRVVGRHLVRVGQALVGAPVPATGFPAPAGRRS